jgi:multicomponent Na+:H+ antiporter subunit C
MEWIIALVIGAIFAAGIASLRRGNRLHLVVGLILLSQAVNLAVFTAAGLVEGHPAILDPAAPPPETVADPLPQALVLTAIVIGLGVTAYLLALLVREARAGSSRPS